ncbi:MAG: Na+/H+ antiporter subunit E [Candidatus Bipolaricaulaceae bacterium]
MVQVLAAFAIGGLLWGLWILLWRVPHWLVVASGAIFPAGLLLLFHAKRITLALPPSVFRVDLWLAFLSLVVGRVIYAVVKTSWAVILGRASPAIVAVPTPLRSEMGQLLLLWAITITPGTIALLVEGETVYVHCLHRPGDPQDLGLSRLIGLLERLWG